MTSIRELIRKDYLQHQKLIWQSHKEVTNTRISLLNSLLGYKQNAQYCFIKYIPKIPTGITQSALLLLEYDGLIILFIYHISGTTVGSDNDYFLGEHKFIPKNDIYSISVQNRKLIIKYKNENTDKTETAEIKIRGLNPGQQITYLLHNYSNKYSDNNEILDNRRKASNKAIQQYCKDITFKDWTNTDISFKDKLASCFDQNTYKTESKSGFLFNLIIIFLITAFTMIFSIVLTSFYNILCLGLIFISIIYVISMYFLILNIIRRLHDIRLSSIYGIFIFLPIINIILLIILCTKPSKPISKRDIENSIKYK